ncbi:acyl-CoA dehydrogenase [Parvularcula flava]|uniref:3-methylmercaptopropionyl-CoA dehydrogenase n=1 Tax=Aquisalinus luteolus TaxID=1566827 RepID=A0A8J3ERY5_9PROT|nr:acyl-CoA dehydrogenase [Aquisalinus luteolus]NHK28971.1 acyl-CoA dehydrogenase [Aquisalinus luteolus]GGI00702.1 acyl-CoA dehydrogenase [Aquisalinus luteolus]
MTYKTPVRDMQFILDHMAGFDAVRQTGAYDDLGPELVSAVLEEVGKLADNVLAPLNQAADEQGANLKDGVVTLPPEFKEAYGQYTEGGWGSLAFPEEYGGQNLPQTLALCVSDALFGACIGLSMGFCLTTGAVKALLAHGTEEQKKLYLEKMVSGEWAGTMNLSEPQAGSDLSVIRTKAEPVGDGRYKIKGNKVWISYGEHDLTENICHLVLARLPDAPEGTRGISMFLVPKYHVNEDGSLGERNDVRCTGIEHKLGQHLSPTCQLAYGDNDACYGTLVGKENEGLKNMFVMMNAARIDVGMQAVSVAEHAFQSALAYAQDRTQGREFGVKSGPQVAIIQHPDVRRQLYTMKALTDASRAICYANMVAHDVAHHSPDEETAKLAKEREELLTPISKGFSSERAIESTSLGIQVFGGMGYVEETGAAQHLRDVRICAIYEGTNGIQAIDLIGRKLGMGGGKLAYDFIAEVKENADALMASSEGDLEAIGQQLKAEAERLEEVTRWMVEAGGRGKAEDALAGASAYLDQFGYVAGGHYLGKGALAAEGLEEGDQAYHASRIAIARFYADNLLPRASACATAAMAGEQTVREIDPALLAG